MMKKKLILKVIILGDSGYASHINCALHRKITLQLLIFVISVGKTSLLQQYPFACRFVSVKSNFFE